MTRITRFLIPSVVLFALTFSAWVEAAPPSKTKPDTTAPGSERNPSSSLIDINSATLADLQSLPGIGSARAHKIVAGRPYASPDELKTRNVLPIKTYDKIRDRISAKAVMGTTRGEHPTPSGSSKQH